MNSKEIKINTDNVAYCGLYCEACGKYQKGKCPGCAGNEKATWCGIRKCCITNNFKSCAECKTYTDLHECKDFHNPISRVIGFVFRADRFGCIDYIKKNGYDNFAKHMAEQGRMSMKR
ncbi:MAG TPA: DUF3795 domain-containing protein [Spirochaetota bacterium]|nr:DUF3795 domain-containing protein [Spirochaetota bacterium]HRX49013.1 DUF3795 domain-containing protein [Spirochaetota bacterium]